MTKNKLGIRFHSEPIYEQKYLKAKARRFDGVKKTNFFGYEVPKEECKYRMKKIKMYTFINNELKSDSDSELGSEEEKSKFDANSMAKLESVSDSE